MLVSGPANGTLTLNPDGSFSYTLNANSHGSDSFTYKANDGLVDSNVATVTVTVNPMDNAHGFYGNVTFTASTAEQPGPIGTVVSAKVGGVAWGFATIAEAGVYGGPETFDPKLLVRGDVASRSMVEFYANGLKANQTHPFRSGDLTQLELTVPIPTPVDRAVSTDAQGVVQGDILW